MIKPVLSRLLRASVEPIVGHFEQTIGNRSPFANHLVFSTSYKSYMIMENNNLYS